MTSPLRDSVRSRPLVLWISRLVGELRAGFLRYFLISLAALAADVAVFTALVYGSPLRPGLAAVVSWCVGLSVHYALARGLLYRNMDVRGTLADRTVQLLVYSSPSIAGLMLTVGVVEAGVWLGFPAVASKLVAAVFSFALAFVMRSLMFGHSSLYRRLHGRSAIRELD